VYSESCGISDEGDNGECMHRYIVKWSDVILVGVGVTFVVVALFDDNTL